MRTYAAFCDLCLPDEIRLAKIKYQGEYGTFHACSTHAKDVKELGLEILDTYEYPGDVDEDTLYA